MRIKIQMFGAFRVLGEQIEVELAEDAVVSDLRLAMAKQAETANLLDLLSASKFANATSILNDTSVCLNGEVLAILPPVSGG